MTELTPDRAETNHAQLISRPIVVVGAPRSGTSMLFQALSSHPELWSLYRESHLIFDRWFPVTMEPGCSSSVTAQQCNDAKARAIEREFFEAVGNVERRGARMSRAIPLIVRAHFSESLQQFGRDKKRPPIRIVEKTPVNCFRLGLLQRVFPDALYVFVVRDPRRSIASVYHGWREETRFGRHPLPQGFTIQDYSGTEWCFGVPPGWENYNGRPLIEVSAFQWVASNEACLRDLPADENRVIRVRYEELTAKPGDVLTDLTEWAGLDPLPLQRYREKLPVVNTWTKPSDEKWRRFEKEIHSVTDLIEPMSQQLGYDLRVGAQPTKDQ